MKHLSEEHLNSKRVQNYAKARNIEIVTGFKRNEDIEDERLEVIFYFIEPKGNQREDDQIWYTIDSTGLFYGGNYQVEGVSDLPHWIETYDQLKELINHLSKEGK